LGTARLVEITASDIRNYVEHLRKLRTKRGKCGEPGCRRSLRATLAGIQSPAPTSSSRRRVRDRRRPDLSQARSERRWTGGNFNRRVWHPAVEAAGVEATRHTLRHSLASLLFERGHTAAQIAALLGHSDPSFTLRTYVHPREHGDVSFLDDVFGGAG
jgi:integrase